MGDVAPVERPVVDPLTGLPAGGCLPCFPLAMVAAVAVVVAAALGNESGVTVGGSAVAVVVVAVPFSAVAVAMAVAVPDPATVLVPAAVVGVAVTCARRAIPK